MLIVNIVLVSLVVLQRLYELVLSRRNQARMEASGVKPGTDKGFPLMVLSHVALLVGCIAEPIHLDRPFIAWIGIPALVLFLLAQLTRVWVVRTLGKHWNVRIMNSGMQGVVSDGPYRYIRHPNYLVVLVEVLTLPLVHSSWITWIVVQVLHTPALIWRIKDEERVLFANPAYVEAMGHKPRFLPRLGGRSAA